MRVVVVWKRCRCQLRCWGRQPGYSWRTHWHLSANLHCVDLTVCTGSRLGPGCCPKGHPWVYSVWQACSSGKCWEKCIVRSSAQRSATSILAETEPASPQSPAGAWRGPFSAQWMFLLSLLGQHPGGVSTVPSWLVQCLGWHTCPFWVTYIEIKCKKPCAVATWRGGGVGVTSPQIVLSYPLS